jgi:hypothetical protein
MTNETLPKKSGQESGAGFPVPAKLLLATLAIAVVTLILKAAGLF